MNDSKRVPTEQAVTDSSPCAAMPSKHWTESLVTPEMLAFELRQDCDIVDGERTIDERIWHGLIRIAARYHAVLPPLGSPPLPTPSTLSSEPLQVGPNKEELGILPNASDMAYTEGFASACSIVSEFLKNKEEFPSEEESRKAFEMAERIARMDIGGVTDVWFKRLPDGKYDNGGLQGRWEAWNACYRWLKGERK